MKARDPGSFVVVLCAQWAVGPRAAGSMAAARARKTKKIGWMLLGCLELVRGEG